MTTPRKITQARQFCTQHQLMVAEIAKTVGVSRAYLPQPWRLLLGSQAESSVSASPPLV